MPTKPAYQNEWHRLRINLITSSSWLINEVKEVLEPFGITQKQFNILRILRGHKGELPLSVLEVRERMLDRMSDASRLVDRLAQKGLVEKQPCTSDKRATRVRISNAGLELLATIDQQEIALDRILHRLSEAEAATLNALMEKMRGE